MKDAPDIALGGILGEIAEAAGVAAALQVAHAKGGTRAFVPRAEYLTMDHWLVQAVGRDAAGKIASYLGNGHIDVPLGPFGGHRARLRAAIDAALREGKSAASIAREVGIHERTVRRHRHAKPADPRQHKLF